MWPIIVPRCHLAAVLTAPVFSGCVSSKYKFAAHEPQAVPMNFVTTPPSADPATARPSLPLKTRRTRPIP